MPLDLTEINDLETLKPLLESCTQSQIDEIFTHYKSMLPELEDMYLRAEYYFSKGRIDITWFADASMSYFNIKEITNFISEHYPNKN